MPPQSEPANTGLAEDRKSVGRSSTLLDRPSGGLSGFIGARQVSWLAAYRRRCLPGPMKVQWRESVGTPLTVAGAATDRRKAYRVPFSPSGEIEGPCCRFMSQLRDGLSNGARNRFCAPAKWKSASPMAQSPRRGWHRKHRKKTSPHFGGQIFDGLGGEPRGPNNVRSSHNAVILASATTGRPGRGPVLSLRWKTLCAEQRFGESALHFMLQTGRVRPEWPPMAEGACESRQNLGADPHEARRAHDGRRANRQRGEAPQELTPRDNKQNPSFVIHGCLLMNTRRQLHSANADADRRSARISIVLISLHRRF